MPERQRKRQFAARRDIAIIGAAALLVIGAWVWAQAAQGARGGVALVTVGTGGAAASAEYPLSRDAMIDIEGEGGITAHLEVSGGRVRFVHSACPDHTCEGFGWLRHEGDWALCAPAAVAVKVTEPVSA